MIWDDLNRMTSYATTTGGDVYRYRADGMRVTKVAGAAIPVVVVGATEAEATAVGELTGPTATAVSGFNDATTVVNQPTWRYYYDGQMGFEDDYTHSGTGGTIVDVKQYGIGMRGMDYMVAYSKTGSGNFSKTDEGYPLYDTHGNNVGIVRRGTNNWYDKNAGQLSERTYDAWGQVASNSPNQGYCANLGHRADDESALVYMRARYYEPSTGRFVSEDSAMAGGNWFAYCNNDPVGQVDKSGKLPEWVVTLLQAGLTGVELVALWKLSNVCPESKTVAIFGLAFLAIWFCDDKFGKGGKATQAEGGIFMYALGHIMGEGFAEMTHGESPASNAVAVFGAYTLVLTMFIQLEFFF